MAFQFRYVPLLRTQNTDAIALAHLDAGCKDRTFPILHLTESVPAAFGAALAKAWQGRTLALDGLFNQGLSGSGTAYTELFNALGDAGVLVVPSILSTAPVPYLRTARPLIGTYAPGAAVKVSLNQLANLGVHIQQWGLKPDEMDIVIDAGAIGDFDLELFAQFVQQAIGSHFIDRGWRSIALAASSAPKDHSALADGRSEVPRLDWQLWQTVHDKMRFHLDYGDFATATPDLAEPAGTAKARVTADVCYATDDTWIILKETPAEEKSTKPSAKQQRTHAEALVAEAKFGGLQNCWADDSIRLIAQGKGVSAKDSKTKDAKEPKGKGASASKASWETIALNRHLSLVATRLP